MSIAKGNVFISHEELVKLFNLPEGVEILTASKDDYHQGVVFNFKIASKEPIEDLTHDVAHWSNMRKKHVPRKSVQENENENEMATRCQCGNRSFVRYSIGRITMCGDCDNPISATRIF